MCIVIDQPQHLPPTKSWRWSTASRKPSNMAIAKFHSLRGEKSALILVKANKFVFASTPCYVPREAVADLKEGDSFELPDGFKLVDMVDTQSGEVRTTEGGEPLKVLMY